MASPLYLDYNATTPLDHRVFEAMSPWLLEAGQRRQSDACLRAAGEGGGGAGREQVAQLIGVTSDEIVFTSGATESNNLAILGLAEWGRETGRTHVLGTAIEHKAVLEPLDRLRGLGFQVELLPVTPGGYVDPDEVKARLRSDTLLVSIMHANNETGVLQPVEEVGRLLEGTSTLFHIDAAQTYGKEVEVLERVVCDFLSISGHKIYGPQGIGALKISKKKLDRRRMRALVVGGGQERGFRSGTLPVAPVVGLGTAAELARAEYRERRNQAKRVKAAFLSGLSGVEHRLNGDPEHCQSHVVNISFPGVDSEALMVELRDVVAISNGSACTSSQYGPSHVLTAMGLDENIIDSAVRISWGQGVDDIPADIFIRAIKQLRM